MAVSGCFRRNLVPTGHRGFRGKCGYIMTKRYIIAISDIHGCWDKFSNALNVYQTEFNPQEDQLILLGDYIDRGPDSRRVVQTIMHLQAQQGVIVLGGNHEDLCVKANSSTDPIEQNLDMQRWMRNGGAQTLASYEGRQAELDHHIAWMRSLPKYYETEHYIFTHASPSPGVSMDEQRDVDIIWGRHTDLVGLGKMNVHGHTPVDEVVLIKDQLFIDTGAVFDGKLSIVALDAEGPEWRVIAEV